jgi:predicted RNA-binding protein
LAGAGGALETTPPLPFCGLSFLNPASVLVDAALVAAAGATVVGIIFFVVGAVGLAAGFLDATDDVDADVAVVDGVSVGGAALLGA